MSNDSKVLQLGGVTIQHLLRPLRLGPVTPPPSIGTAAQREAVSSSPEILLANQPLPKPYWSTSISHLTAGGTAALRNTCRRASVSTAPSIATPICERSRNPSAWSIGRPKALPESTVGNLLERAGDYSRLQPPWHSHLKTRSQP